MYLTPSIKNQAYELSINSKGANSIHLPERPGFLQAAKLKTTYNVAPQEEEVNRVRNRSFEDIDAGTASSLAF